MKDDHQLALTIQKKRQLDPPLQVSKWLSCPLLISDQEMIDLLSQLPSFYFIQTSGVIQPGEEIIDQERFLKAYQQYILALKQGEILSEQLTRPYFSCAMTTHLDAFYKVMISDTQQLVKACRPIIQLQAHRFDYSTVDKKFRSMVLGAQSISWGIVFSYPQLFQDDQFQVHAIRENSMFPNTQLFKHIQKGMRHLTIPTPFEMNGEIKNVPIRLGKQCLEWINNHPQLQAKGLKVYCQ